MARDKDGSSPISLFSFQDIITSLTGIMFLVVMMLLLIILTPHGTPESNDPETQKLIEQVTQLREQYEALNKAKADIEQELAELEKVSDAEIALQLQQLRLTISNLRQAVEDLMGQQRKKEYEIEEQQKKLAEKKQLIQEQAKELQTQIQENQEAEKKLEELRKLTRQKERVMQYTVIRGSRKIPQLLEISQDGGRILNIENDEKTDLLFPGEAFRFLAELKKYVSTLDANRYYFSVIVRPDGFRYAAAVTEMLKEANFERGLEILPDNDTSIFPEDTP